MNVLEQFGIVPIDFATLETVLREYRYPRNKVSQNGEKRGIDSPQKGGICSIAQYYPHDNFQGANRKTIYMVRLIFHLRMRFLFINLFRKRVHTTRSMTLKRARKFSTPLGNFDYISAPKDYFQIGIRQEIVSDKYAYLIASPEKTICDMIIATPGLRFAIREGDANLS